MGGDGGSRGVTQRDMTRVFPRHLTCLIRHPTHNVDRGHKKHEGHQRTNDILQSTQDRVVAASLPDGAMGARLNRNKSHLLFSAFAGITGLSCALTLVVGYLGPRHDGLGGAKP